MEGYSVTEAASVLGVPTERVWELLARGVLSGAPEGETGMRVYLQPRPAPAPVEPTGPNGDGGTREPERELSPFRELLTEFRNLTERYGQALLALGEARGEVASLRSRVDLLEARMDLRLPMGQPQAAGWSSTPMPPPLERAVMPAAPVDALVEQPPPSEPHEGAEEEERRARARGPRRATESFAEALARAEDPSPPELPAATEAAAGQRQPSDVGADVGLPREAAGAEEIPVADVADEAVAVAVDETAVLEAAPEPVEVEVAPEPIEAAPEPVEVEPIETSREPVEVQPEPIEAAPEEVEASAAPAEAPPEPREPAPEPVEAPAELAPIVEESEPVVDDAHPTFEPAEEPVPLVAAAAPAAEVDMPDVAEPQQPETHDAEGEAEAAPTNVEPMAWDAERYTTDIEEPDWFAAEIDEAVPAAPIADEPGPESPSDQADAAASQVAEEAAALPDVAARPDSEKDPISSAPDTNSLPTVEEEPVETSGADEMEVTPAATQAETPGVPSASARPFPGAHDLEEAIAALRAAGRAAEPLPEPEPQAAVDQGEDASDEWPPRSAFARPATPGAATRGPASRAYRRLRRIFPS